MRIMVPGIILASYRNRGGAVTDEGIRTGIRRGSKVPGGTCGLMGICGAAIGVGVAFGVILESTPLAPVERCSDLVATAEVLAEISRSEAARCCQRECFVALRKTSDLSRDRLPITLWAEVLFDCEPSADNAKCIGAPRPRFGSAPPAS